MCKIPAYERNDCMFPVVTESGVMMSCEAEQGEPSGQRTSAAFHSTPAASPKSEVSRHFGTVIPILGKVVLSKKNSRAFLFPDRGLTSFVSMGAAPQLILIFSDVSEAQSITEIQCMKHPNGVGTSLFL